MWRLSRYWVYWAAWASITGWGLSVIHLLNGTGYLLSVLAVAIALGCIFYWHPEAFRTSRTPGQFIVSCGRGLRRRPLQLGFALMALLIFISGSLYVPWSFDAESYRLPRILYWWTHNGWFWINPPDNRLDYSSVGFEWEMLPVILLTRTDRFLFLLNWIPFLFLPALLLQFLRLFEVRRALIRVLIWVIPSGYCYALQAGSIQNDGYAALYLLAAFVFLHSHQRHGKMGDLVISLLAAALLTGAKSSNIFLLLPYGVMLLLALWKSPKSIRGCLVAAIPAVAVSVIPLMALCYFYTGDPTGDPKNLLANKTTHHVATMAANLILMFRDATQPPVALFLNQPLEHFSSWFSHLGVIQHLQLQDKNFSFGYGEFVYEGNAGIGMGVVVTLLIVVVLNVRRWTTQSPYPNAVFAIIAACSWFSFLVCLGMLASDQMSRLCAAYYPLLIATLPWMSGRSKERSPRLLTLAGLFALATTVLLVVVSPIRPVAPIVPLLQHLAAVKTNGFATSTLAKYQFWSNLRDNLAPIRASLPANGDPIGFGGGNRETSYGLWKPLGSRKVYDLVTPDPRDLTRDHHVHLAVVTERGTHDRFGMTLSDWLQRYRIKTLQTYKINNALTTKTHNPLDTWLLVTWD